MQKMDTPAEICFLFSQAHFIPESMFVLCVVTYGTPNEQTQISPHELPFNAYSVTAKILKGQGR